MTSFQHPTLENLLLAATVLACPLILAAPTPAAAQVGIVISVQAAPPILPVYCTAPAAGIRVYLDAGLLELERSGWLLLGAWHLGGATGGRPVVDSALLGLE